MHKTIEAIMEPGGKVFLTEHIKSTSRQRVLVTILDDPIPQNPTKLKLDWRGGLKDFTPTDSSVDLQHKILGEWDKNVSR